MGITLLTSEENTGNNKFGAFVEKTPLQCCNVTKAETKHSKIDGGLKNVFSIKMAVKPRL